MKYENFVKAAWKHSKRFNLSLSLMPEFPMFAVSRCSTISAIHLYYNVVRNNWLMLCLRIKLWAAEREMGRDDLNEASRKQNINFSQYLFVAELLLSRRIRFSLMFNKKTYAAKARSKSRDIAMVELFVQQTYRELLLASWFYFHSRKRKKLLQTAQKKENWKFSWGVSSFQFLSSATKNAKHWKENK